MEIAAALNEADVKRFSEDGFLILRGLLSADEVRDIRDTFMAIAMNGPVAGLSDYSAKSGQSSADPLARYPRMMHPHRHMDKPVGPLATRYMLDARIGMVLADLMREEPVAVQSMFYFKPPGARGQDLHQDNFYLRVSPGTCMAAWMAIDDADRGNGGMVLVPGTQNMRIACPGAADPAKFFTTEHVPVPEGMHEYPADLRAGDVLFFNGNVIHGSYPNTSTDRFRRALICHYVPISTHELSHWYKDPMRFNGEAVQIAEATGGGPCGTVAEAAAPH